MGALFLALRTMGEPRATATRYAAQIGLLTLIAGGVFLVITQLDTGKHLGHRGGGGRRDPSPR